MEIKTDNWLNILKFNILLSKCHEYNFITDGIKNRNKVYLTPNYLVKLEHYQIEEIIINLNGLLDFLGKELDNSKELLKVESISKDSYNQIKLDNYRKRFQIEEEINDWSKYILERNSGNSEALNPITRIPEYLTFDIAIFEKLGILSSIQSNLSINSLLDLAKALKTLFPDKFSKSSVQVIKATIQKMRGKETASLFWNDKLTIKINVALSKMK